MSNPRIEAAQKAAKRPPSWALGVCLLATCLIAAAGCGGDGRHALEGTVTLDGQPLAEGQIAFVPQSGTGGPTAGGKIRQGRFSIAAKEGVLAGSFRVEITASRKTGKQATTETGEKFDQVEQYLPARYNRQSELTAEVPDGGAKQLEFALQSH